MPFSKNKYLVKSSKPGKRFATDQIFLLYPVFIVSYINFLALEINHQIEVKKTDAEV